MIDDITLTEAFILGALTMAALTCVWFGVPALVREVSIWLDDRRNPRPTVAELLDLDRCDLCLVELDDDNAAVTCSAHRYCAGCDDYANRCTACAYERGLAAIEERA